MKKQTYANHKHYVVLYHLLTFFAMACLVCGGVYLVFAENVSPRLLPCLFLLLVLTVISVSFHCRSFALKAQDRAIRAEENLRYFMLTGRRLDPSLSLYQVIALRFAGDDEFVQLAERAVKEQLSPDEIKRNVKHWRADHHRA